jgi:hypothetical protein
VKVGGTEFGDLAKQLIDGLHAASDPPGSAVVAPLLTIHRWKAAHT